MDEYFNKFEKQLEIVENKLDILSEWHLSKKHHGAAEIAEDCRTTMTGLWIEFHQLTKTYKQQEAEHETFLDVNISNLLGELKKHDELMADNSIRLGKERPNWLLFDYLNKAVRNFTDPGKLATSDTMNIWWYLQDLVVKDFEERGL